MDRVGKHGPQPRRALTRPTRPTADRIFTASQPRLAIRDAAPHPPGMATVIFASAIQRHVPTAPVEVAARTLGEALEQVFARHPLLRSYILDDQSAVRKHVAVLIDGTPVQDRATLADAIAPNSEIHVLQALSGG